MRSSDQMNGDKAKSAAMKIGEDASWNVMFAKSFKQLQIYQSINQSS